MSGENYYFSFSVTGASPVESGGESGGDTILYIT